MSLFGIWLAYFSFKQFPAIEFEICNILLLKAIKELGCGVVFVANIKKVKRAVSQNFSKIQAVGTATKLSESKITAQSIKRRYK